MCTAVLPSSGVPLYVVLLKGAQHRIEREDMYSTA